MGFWRSGRRRGQIALNTLEAKDTFFYPPDWHRGMTHLVVQLSADFADSYAVGGARAEPLRRVLRELDVNLSPLAEGIDDPVLSTFFQAELPSEEIGAKVVTRLAKLPGVSAAYIEPEVALP